MDTLIHGLRSALELGLAPFDALPRFWGLTLLSALSGAFMLWVVGKTTPQRRVDIARARMASAIYELRLFLDSPGRILRSQARLLGWSFAYVGYVMPAFLILSLPFGLLYFHLDVRHGQAPLPVGTPVVIQVSLDQGTDPATVAPGDLPEGLRVTAPPLRAMDEHRVYLRAVIDTPGTYTLPVRVGDEVIEKRLVADPGALAVSPERCRGLCLLDSYGHEPLLPGDSGVTSIAVAHPAAPQSWLGTSMPWWVYALLLATAAALALRRPLNVTL